jgi:heme oxygenase (staphylobilin-producing)
MNVVQAAEGRAEALEQAFLERERLLAQAEGFLAFDFLRREGDNEYVVLTRWESKDAFKNWVKSDLFKRSHRHANSSDEPLAIGNELRTYEVLDSEVQAGVSA